MSRIFICIEWVAIEPENREILVRLGKHSVSTDGCGTWRPMACEFIKLDHHIHSFFGKEEKSHSERTIQYIKNRTKSFDDYFPCCRK